MTAHEMPLNELVTRFKPLGADSWEELSVAFLENEFDRETIEHLRADLRATGRFREPVVVSVSDEQISNGQHRIVASLLEGRESVMCDTEPLFTEQLPNYDISVVLQEPEVLKLVEDRLMSAVRSFKVTDKLWAECFLSIRAGVIELSCECADQDIDKIVSCIDERLKRLGLFAESVKVTKYESAESDTPR